MKVLADPIQLITPTRIRKIFESHSMRDIYPIIVSEELESR